MHEVVVGALVRADRVLLVHRSPHRAAFPGVWDLPGGHVEPGESELAALARELYEELGVHLVTAAASHLGRLDVAGGADAVRLSVWLVQDWHGPPRNLAPEEHDDIGWVGVEELPPLAQASVGAMLVQAVRDRRARPDTYARGMTSLADTGLRLDVSDAVATVTLDRPDRRNAQTPAMWHALAEIGDQLPATVRVVVVRGAGQSFSAGLDRAMLDPATGDVARLLELDDAGIGAAIDGYQRGFTWLRDTRFISVAAVQGYAIGAGFQLALSCDLRVLAEDAQLCMKEPALGLVPDLTGTKPLVEAVGYQRALEICATTRMVGAAEAVEIGLALTAVPVDRLDATVADLAQALTANVAGAVAETKRLLLTAAEHDLDTQRRLEREAQVRRFRELAALLQPQE